ncbi:MAG: hypothetical protein DMG17_32700 [Acidobacteria bacterium]|nr:MAG: hypothetical protein DMG17_32700 [Acidobacteriota bacterium]
MRLGRALPLLFTLRWLRLHPQCAQQEPIDPQIKLVFIEDQGRRLFIWRLWLASQLAAVFCSIPSGLRYRGRIIESMGTATYLDRLLEPLTDILTPEVASALVGLRADAELQAHIDELRRKANEGTLTAVEDAEYKDFVEAVDLISIIQAKARQFLAKQSA